MIEYFARRRITEEMRIPSEQKILNTNALLNVVFSFQYG